MSNAVLPHSTVHGLWSDHDSSLCPSACYGCCVAVVHPGRRCVEEQAGEGRQQKHNTTKLKIPLNMAVTSQNRNIP